MGLGFVAIFLGCRSEAETGSRASGVSTGDREARRPAVAHRGTDAVGIAQAGVKSSGAVREGEGGETSGAATLGLREASAVDPDLVVVYTASSQGFLEPCGCYAKGKELGGIARRASVVDSLRSEGAPVLLVESGDFVGGSGPAGREVGEATLRIMKSMRYDAIALGEAELALGSEFLERVAAAGPSLAHANYSHPALGPPQADGLLVEKNGLKIGLIGLLDPALLPPDLGLEELVVQPPGPAAAAAAASLRRRGADLVVVLGHAGFRASGTILTAAEGVNVGASDVWIVGHGGKELSHPHRVAETLLLGAGNAGKLVGIFELELDEAAPRFANRLYPLRMTVPEDAAIARIVKTVNPAILERLEAAEQSES